MIKLLTLKDLTDWLSPSMMKMKIKDVDLMTTNLSHLKVLKQTLPSCVFSSLLKCSLSLALKEATKNNVGRGKSECIQVLLFFRAPCSAVP